MTINATEARRDLFGLIRRVVDDHAPERIASKNGTVVIMSEEDYDAWQETLYLLSTPANAAALNESIAQLNAGRGKVHELIDPDEPGA